MEKTSDWLLSNCRFAHPRGGSLRMMEHIIDEIISDKPDLSPKGVASLAIERWKRHMDAFYGNAIKFYRKWINEYRIRNSLNSKPQLSRRDDLARAKQYLQEMAKNPVRGRANPPPREQWPDLPYEVVNPSASMLSFPKVTRMAEQKMQAFNGEMHEWLAERDQREPLPEPPISEPEITPLVAGWLGGNFKFAALPVAWAQATVISDRWQLVLNMINQGDPLPEIASKLRISLRMLLNQFEPFMQSPGMAASRDAIRRKAADNLVKWQQHQNPHDPNGFWGQPQSKPQLEAKPEDRRPSTIELPTLKPQRPTQTIQFPPVGQRRDDYINTSRGGYMPRVLRSSLETLFSIVDGIMKEEKGKPSADIALEALIHWDMFIKKKYKKEIAFYYACMAKYAELNGIRVPEELNSAKNLKWARESAEWLLQHPQPNFQVPPKEQWPELPWEAVDRTRQGMTIANIDRLIQARYPEYFKQKRKVPAVA